jgi:hypothetical protein
MSIATLKNLPDDEWVNDPITGTIHDAKSLKNGQFYVAKMTYSGITISLFTKAHDLTEFEGKVVEINGSGIKKVTDEFKGTKTPKLLFGDKSVIKVLGSGPVSETVYTPPPAPVSATYGTQGKAAAPGAGRYGNIQGQTVGMAVNNAINLMKEAVPPDALDEYCKSGAFSKDVAQIAGAIIKVSMFLEQGNLDGYPKQANENFTEDDLPEDDSSDEPAF